MYNTNETACQRYTMELLATGNSYCCLSILYGDVSLKRSKQMQND